MDVNATIPPNMDTCPAPLRAVVMRWKNGQATNAELVEASDRAQLELLHEYRKHALPTPPDELQEHRNLSEGERYTLDQKKRTALLERCRDFFLKEHAVWARNYAQRFQVRDLLLWAMGQPSCDARSCRNPEHLATHPPRVEQETIERIQQALYLFQDMEMVQAPDAIREVFG